MRKLIFCANLKELNVLKSSTCQFSLSGDMSAAVKKRNMTGFNTTPGSTIVATLAAGATGWHAPADTIILFTADCLRCDHKYLIQASARNAMAKIKEQQS